MAVDCNVERFVYVVISRTTAAGCLASLTALTTGGVGSRDSCCGDRRLGAVNICRNVAFKYR